MRKFLLLYFVALPIVAHSQTGLWTWMNGYNVFNGVAVFGTQGTPDPANKPPALWSAFFWTDSNGNFWLFGGLKNGQGYSALWMYDPALNLWTWMKGPNTSS